MKTAYELAMERMGETKKYSEKQKAKLAEIDSKYEAKKAEVQFAGNKQLQDAAGNPEKTEEVKRHLARDLERIEEKREKEKDSIRE